jgi:hypothetical protein
MLAKLEDTRTIKFCGYLSTEITGMKVSREYGHRIRSASANVPTDELPFSMRAGCAANNPSL